ncbi:MAG: hypothetical protein ACOCXK_02935 [Rhodosalinus sp.]
MGLLLSGGGVTGKASPQTTPLQKIIKVRQRRERYARRAQFHACARCRVEHPGRHHREDAWQNLYMEELSRPAPVDALDPQAPAEKRVPAVTDHDKLPDMGRMNGQWPDA